jgi:hypothetical protein
VAPSSSQIISGGGGPASHRIEFLELEIPDRLDVLSPGRPQSAGFMRSVGPQTDRQTFQNSPGDGKDYPETELLVYTIRG